MTKVCPTCLRKWQWSMARTVITLTPQGKAYLDARKAAR